MLPSLPLLTQLTSAPFKRAQTGLFHGKLIQFGNNVPFSKHKTRRTWLPNIQQKGLRSELLDREVTLKVSTKALKTIKKLGGLDQYILNTRHDLLGPEGMRIRLKLREKQEEQARQAVKEARRAQREREARNAQLALSQAEVRESEAAGEKWQEEEQRRRSQIEKVAL